MAINLGVDEDIEVVGIFSLHGTVIISKRFSKYETRYGLSSNEGLKIIIFESTHIFLRTMIKVLENLLFLNLYSECTGSTPMSLEKFKFKNGNQLEYQHQAMSISS